MVECLKKEKFQGLGSEMSFNVIKENYVLP